MTLVQRPAVSDIKSITVVLFNVGQADVIGGACASTVALKVKVKIVKGQGHGSLNSLARI